LAMAYEVAWRRVEALQSAASPAAWLYGVAINCLLNVRRGNRRRSDLDRQVLAQPEIDPSNDPGVVVQFTDELERVEAILATMPERDREALRLTAYEGFTPSEVAEALGIRKRLVRSVLYRARRQLNARLESSVEWRDEDLPSTLRQAVDGDSDA
ncbi:MAG TPA: sigma-70 family RNA polymerase sigma factor, partial [Acidimicrobiia bacterium]|nr:sigma-70 family RNA polymerase sigma factor [Acidimicrobiia bacterium]